jgi:hypothetical protein
MYRGFTLGRSPANMLHLKPFNFNYTVGTGTQNLSRLQAEHRTQSRRGPVGQDEIAKRCSRLDAAWQCAKRLRRWSVDTPNPYAHRMRLESRL